MKRISAYFYLFTLVLTAGTSLAIIRLKRLKESQSPITGKTNELHRSKDHLIGIALDVYNLYFRGEYRPTWHRGVQQTTQERNAQKVLFGHNLQLEHIVDHDANMETNHKRPTLYLHGFADYKQSAKVLKALGDVLPGDIITFNFHDRGPGIPKIAHANLGQMHDILQALYALKWAKDRLNLTEIDLFGYSRGGATVLNMIAVLNDKTGKYDKELDRLSIDQKERTALLAMIQNGSIILNCPLTDVNVVAAVRFDKYAPKVLKAGARISQYRVDGIQAIDSANKFDGLKLNVLMHFQYHDTIVSNNNESELYHRLAQYNPENTYIVLGNNGGHIHTHAALAHACHTFRKLYGGSYDPAYDAQYHATRTLLNDANVLLQPGGAAEDIIKNYYKRCKQEQCASRRRRR